MTQTRTLVLVFLAMAVVFAVLPAPPVVAAEKLCRASPALEQSVEACREDDIVLAIFPKPTGPQPSLPRPAPSSRIASLVARICDLRREVFLQPGSTDEEFVLTCVYAGRILTLP